MSSDRIDLVVILDAPELGPARPVGVLTRWPGRVLSVGFSYARSWLDDHGHRFPIDPSLPLDDAPRTIPGRRLPGILDDTTPDSWGETLMVRRADGRALDAWAFLVGVDDQTRMGALRLRHGVDGPFLADDEPPVPPFHRLQELEELARRFEDDPDDISAAELAALLAPGSSLGGARPKANFVKPDGSLWIGKFPSRTDRRDVAAWEHVYARLAGAAGIDVPDTELLDLGGHQRTFATRRFDRTLRGRRLYASALTLTGRASALGADYVDIAQAIADNGATEHVSEDLAQLYRRMAFNVLAGNRDDHLRNHGFLRAIDGWRLAPAFDLNPAREMREHATAIGGTSVAPTATDVLDIHEFFGLSRREAAAIVREVAAAIAELPRLAKEAGIGRSEQRQVGVALAALETATSI